MTPAPNPFYNHILKAPVDMEGEVHQLEVLIQHPYIISCWEPSEEELKALNEGKRIWLCLMSTTCPPIAMSVGDRP